MPKLSTCAKEMSEAQGGVARDAGRSIQHLRDALGLINLKYTAFVANHDSGQRSRIRIGAIHDDQIF